MLDTLTNPPTDPTAPKGWASSRTLIINGVLTLVFALGLVGQLAGVFQIDPRWVALAGATAAVINFWLRLDTNSAVAGTPAAAVANKAKEDIALHAAVTAPAPAAAAVYIPVAPTLDALPGLLKELTARHNADGAMLAELANIAGPPSLGAVPP